MEFDNTFAVTAPIDEVWRTLLDLERVAPCVPGAEVIEQTSDTSYKVGIKIKVGPISMTYKGDIEILEQDESAHRALMRAKAREARGQGTADAQVTMTLTQAGDTTEGQIHSDVKLSGKVAAMGGGVIKDVSSRIIDTFAANLQEMLSGAPAAGEPAATGGSNGTTTAAALPAAEAPAGNDAPASPAGAQSATPEAADGPGAAEAPAAAAPPPRAPRPSASAEEQSLPVGAIAASIAKERLLKPPVIAGVLLVLLVLLRRHRRS
jgi:carbon monoxide dehydrogenase subunit G